MKKDLLISVIETRKVEIRGKWAKEVASSSPRYADRSTNEINASIDEMLAGLCEALSKGEYSRLFEFLNRMVALRSSMGFRLTELQRVVNIGTSIIMDELMTECDVDEHDACFAATRKLLDVMYWASMNLGDTFEEIRSKEFTAGTLVALGAAQEDTNEREIMRKSLELVMSLMRCTHGAISMQHLGGCTVTVPKGHQQSEELFSRLSGRVTREKRALLLNEEGIKELVRSELHDIGGNVTCAAGIPIKTRGRVLGALLLGSISDVSPSEHEVRFLEAVASQIGLACDNARMIQQIKHKEESIRKEHDEILTVMNELGAMVYVSDMATYELLAANRPTLEVFGKDIVGKTCYKVLQTDQQGPCEFCTNHRLVKDGRPTGPYMWKFQNTRTGRWFQCLDRAIEWPDGRLARLEIALDITDLENAKQLLEKTQSMLELYNDLLVHDVGNYAGTAKAFVQLLVQEDTPADRKDEMARTALAQLTRIDTLIDRMSKLTKTHAKGPETMVRHDLAAVVDEAISDVSATTEGSRVEFRKEYERRECYSELGEFVLDIFANLLTNAVKYGGGKPVTVRISGTTMSCAPAWKVSVVDEGGGILPEKKSQLFGRFVRVTTLSQLKGLGLGLTIVKTLAEAYGGVAEVEDRVHGDHTKGSIFSVTFPKAGP